MRKAQHHLPPVSEENFKYHIIIMFLKRRGRPKTRKGLAFLLFLLLLSPLSLPHSGLVLIKPNLLDMETVK